MPVELFFKRTNRSFKMPIYLCIFKELPKHAVQSILSSLNVYPTTLLKHFQSMIRRVWEILNYFSPEQIIFSTNFKLMFKKLIFLSFN